MPTLEDLEADASAAAARVVAAREQKQREDEDHAESERERLAHVDWRDDLVRVMNEALATYHKTGAVPWAKWLPTFRAAYDQLTTSPHYPAQIVVQHHPIFFALLWPQVQVLLEYEDRG